ncbi:putative RING finger protein C6B12.07c [Cladobotryum mycophilum]|uniref:RING finger protein C6B12.07c n=1 Tax=Cladobotryum mycophilum TaxID=491253 RepID=A0ABR0SVK9_9HYPO
MKFARDFKESLASQGFPPHWVALAIPYGQLKKCLKKVQRELRDLGLDSETLRLLLDPHTTSPVALQYNLNASADSSLIRPKLTVNIHLQNGVAIDASLAPTSRLFLEKIAAELSRERTVIRSEPQIEFTGVQQSKVNNTECDSDQHDTGKTSLNQDAYEIIEVPLVFDGEFFHILQSDVNNLDALQAEEQKNMTSEILELGREVSRVSRPSRFSKSDLTRWRRIFEVYLDAEIFFATHERDHGARNSQKALKQLQWFQTNIEKQQLASGFKLQESQIAFSRFLQLNLTLLKCLQFQELNKLAITKILKKFDKRTSLGISNAFPAAVNSERLLTNHVAKDICAHMSQELVSVIPQLNDYLCPICYSVAYRPVRLDCQHVFCIRCVIKIQRRKEKHCPMCRAEVIMNASEDHLDHDLEKFMKKYFPREVKEKQRANEIESGIEEFGPGYTQPKCIIM